MPRRVPALFSSLVALGLLVGAALFAAPGALAGGGCHADMTGAVHTDGPASVVRMDICSFEPTVARVAVGAEVRFLNTSTLEHAVLGRGQSWGAGDTMQPGASRVERFGEAGVFPYSCPLHPGMVGTIVVGDANTPPSTTGAAVGHGDAQPAEAPAAETRAEAAAGPATGLEPLAAVGLGGATGLAVLGLAAFVVRRRPGSASIPG